MILALDLGTKCGYAIGLPDGGTLSGVWDLSSRRFEGGGMRFLRFRRMLDEIHEVREVLFEEVRRHVATDAAHVYGGLLAVLSSWCEEREIPYQGVPVGTIKKHATGKGNAKKEQMIEAARLMGYMPKDDNEADALCLLNWWRTQQASAQS